MGYEINISLNIWDFVQLLLDGVVGIIISIRMCDLKIAFV